VGVEVAFHREKLMEENEEKITQDYKLELIVQVDVNGQSTTWLQDTALPAITRVYSYSIKAIDTSQAEYKFIEDMKCLK